ncbi:DNA repair protein RadC [Pseudomonas veronii subsp. inensis]|uniref:JAB domain-containing protein n=1 Tax=Pseudomonas veronii TaxID=76761 RepID=UPI0031F8F48B
MKYHKLIAGETTGTYDLESPITEADILQMAQQLAMSRLSKGRALTEPKHVISHLQTLLQYHEHEVFALLLLDTKHRVIGFRELFRGTPDEASVHPREVVKISLEHNAAAAILVHKVHNHPSGDPEPSQTDRALTATLKNALNMIGTQLLDHVVVGYEGGVSLAERGLL